MTLDYIEGVTFKVGMIDYINEIIAAFNKLYPIGRHIKTIATPEEL